jgi:hypothetical protein
VKKGEEEREREKWLKAGFFQLSFSGFFSSFSFKFELLQECDDDDDGFYKITTTALFFSRARPRQPPSDLEQQHQRKKRDAAVPSLPPPPPQLPLLLPLPRPPAS